MFLLFQFCVLQGAVVQSKTQNRNNKNIPNTHVLHSNQYQSKERGQTVLPGRGSFHLIQTNSRNKWTLRKSDVFVVSALGRPLKFRRFFPQCQGAAYDNVLQVFKIYYFLSFYARVLVRIKKNIGQNKNESTFRTLWF